MKKIVWALFLLATAQVAIGQQPEIQQTEQNQKDKTVSKKSETRVSKKDDAAPATMDGKAFKITFIAKNKASAPEEVNVEKNAQPGSVTPDKSDKKEMNLMGETKTENKMPDQATTNATATGQDQMTIASLDNTKGRLSFENGMIRIDMAKDGRHLEECNYQVTTGSKDFGTFSGNCSKGYGIPSDPVGHSAPVDKTAAPVAAQTQQQPVSTQTDISTDQPGGITGEKDPTLKGNETTDPEMKNKDAAAWPEKATENNQINQGNNQVQPAAPATTAQTTMPSEMPTTAIITGFVDGKSIKGTIIIKENGQRVMYSYTGTLDTKKAKPATELGMR